MESLRFVKTIEHKSRRRRVEDGPVKENNAKKFAESLAAGKNVC